MRPRLDEVGVGEVKVTTYRGYRMDNEFCL